jgi:phage/plasmid primase-like uncharacterized protein
MTPEESFRAALHKAGIEYNGPICIDGKLHRIKANGDHSKNSWYVLYPGPPAAGRYGCWKRDIKKTWCERDGSLTQSEWQNVCQRWREAKAQLAAETVARQEKAREVAAWILNRSRPARTLHRYLFRKRVKVFGNVRQYRRSLVLPLHDIKGELQSLQFISGDGTKHFLTGGRVAGCFFTLADKADGSLVICEGYATGATIHEATGGAVICAMNSGNLVDVAKVARELWPQREIIVAGDNDQFRDGNPGLTKATAAAKAIRAQLAVPQFKDIANKPTDFNDLAVAEGLGAVRAQVSSAQVSAGIDSQAKRLVLCPATRTGTPRIAKLIPPSKPLTCEQWRSVIKRNFPTLVGAAEICLSVEAQLLLNDVCNPFALALVDVPSSGKTIILNFFDGPSELSYTTDNFTPASFVSHASNVKRDELSAVDLLPRIRYHTLIVRELGSIFGAKDDDLIKSLGILTRVLDGEGLETDSGVHGKRGYKGDYLFMLLAGTPPIPPRVFKIMGNLGSRLFFVSLHTPDENDDELIAQNKGTTRKLKESECKTATENFLRTLWANNLKGVEWNRARDPDDCLRVIARCARLLASLRGAINVWHSDDGGEKLSHNVPVIEKPHRINCLLYNLARAHALICGRQQLEDEDLWPVLDVTFDSAPTTRAKLFRGLIKAGGTLNTSQVVKLLRCSPPTARKEMEALCVLDVAEKTAEGDGGPGHPETQIRLAAVFSWFGSEDCRRLMRETDAQGGNLFAIQPGPGIKKEFPPCVTAKDGGAPDAKAAADGAGTFLPAGQSIGEEKLCL